MHIQFTFKELMPSTTAKEFATRTLQKLYKTYSGIITRANVAVQRFKVMNMHAVEITLRLQDGSAIHAKNEAKTIEHAVDQTVADLEAMLVRLADDITSVCREDNRLGTPEQVGDVLNIVPKQRAPFPPVCQSN